MFSAKIRNLTILILVVLPFLILAQSQNCINYTGGIGELETIFPDTNHFFYEKVRELAVGLFDYNTLNPNLKIETEIDKEIKASEFGSQKISIFKESNKIVTSSPYFLINIPGNDSLGIRDEFRDFYPKIGDKVKASVKVKTSEKIHNIRYQVRITARVYEEGIPTNTGHPTFAYFITSTPLLDWTDINLNFNIPQLSQPYKKLETIFFRIDFYFPSSTDYASGTFWFDKVDFFVERNDKCLQWPLPLRGSLKILEVYGFDKPRDFIANYYYNSGHLGSYYTDLIIKNYDQNYKYFFYINLTPMSRYFYSQRGGWTIRNFNGEINQYFDEMKIITSTGNCIEEIMPLRPNARYPEFLKLNKDIPNRYKLHGCLAETYMGAIVNYTDADLMRNQYLSHIYRLDSYFINPNLKYDAIFFDNFMPAASEISKQTPDNLSIQKKFSEFAHFIHQKVGTLFKYIGNWGYVPYINEDNIFDIRNFYLIKNLYNGYLDEGWLWSPYDLLNNFLPNPRRTHLIFKTAIENDDYDYIMLIGAFFDGNCTSSNEITSYIISSYYLVNNKNTYFTLRPISSTTGIRSTYAKPQCYDNSMYLPLGNPLEVKKIEEMIVTSTPNFTNGALYLRKYEKGLVLLNSSNNFKFQYQLPYGGPYFDQFGRTYISYQTINIDPRSGLIIYFQPQILE